MATVSLSPKKTGFTITGELLGDSLGYSASTAGDINKDGFDDFIIGTYQKDSYKGAVYVIYGGETSSFSNVDFSLQTPDPVTTGFTIKGQFPMDSLGVSVSTAGDINKDGYDDIIVGAYAQIDGRGAAYVIYGGEKSSLSDIDLSIKALDPATTGFKISGENYESGLGISVSTAGDVNGDGYDDIIVGARNLNFGKSAAFVFYGGEKSSLSNFDFGSMVLADPNKGFSITMAASYSGSLGCAVSTAGDINKDGYDDIIVGACGINKAYVFYGGEKSSLSNVIVTDQTITPATAGFIISAQSSTSFGTPVSTVGDINKDGYDDFIIGDIYAESSRGIAYVIYGRERSSFSNFVVNSPALNPATTGFTIKGYDAYNRLGNSLSGIGDINKDGYDDFIVGDAERNLNIGEVYVIYGREKSLLVNIDLSSMSLDPATTGFTLTGNANGDKFGTSVSLAGDINKDGYPDLIIGAPGIQTDTGQVLVYHLSISLL